MHVNVQLTLNNTSSISSTGVASAAIARKGTRHPPTQRRCPPMADRCVVAASKRPFNTGQPCDAGGRVWVGQLNAARWCGHASRRFDRCILWTHPPHQLSPSPTRHTPTSLTLGVRHCAAGRVDTKRIKTIVQSQVIILTTRPPKIENLRLSCPRFQQQ